MLSLLSLILVYLLIPGPLKEDKIVIIEPGSTIKQITLQLSKEQIIHLPTLFYAISASYDLVKSPLKSGEYSFIKGVSALRVIRTLSSGKSINHKFLVTEGELVYNVIAKLKNEPRLIGDIEENVTEGFLMPSTYYFSFRDQRSKILLDMKRNMSTILDIVMEELEPDSPLKTRLDVLTLASIVEKEALYDQEKPRIAAVFINRLKKNMKLQADPTSIYAITHGKKKLGRMLTRKDLKIKSDYNTYYVKGLPPTPISCPGLKSIEAVIKPLKTKELYFVVDGKGGHRFATNYSDHRKNIAAYKRLRRRR